LENARPIAIPPFFHPLAEGKSLSQGRTVDAKGTAALANTGWFTTGLYNLHVQWKIMENLQETMVYTRFYHFLR
jgi:hypothetical protein